MCVCACLTLLVTLGFTSLCVCVCVCASVLVSHPAGHDGVHLLGVLVAEGHEVGVEGPDPLEAEPDEAGGGEVQQGGGGVLGAGPPVDQRGVDLRTSRGVDTQVMKPSFTQTAMTVS